MKSYLLQTTIGQLGKEQVIKLDSESRAALLPFQSKKKGDSTPFVSRRRNVRLTNTNFQPRIKIAIATVVIIGLFISLMVWPWKHHFLYAAMLYLSGLFAWTFAEYLWHRFVIHGSQQKRPAPHEAQHLDGHFPCGRHRALIILIVTVALLLSIWQNIYFLLCCGLFSGCLASCYMRIFMQWKGMAKLLPALHRQHLYHLAGGNDRGYGWTTTFWDYLFDTHVPLGYVYSDKKAE